MKNLLVALLGCAILAACNSGGSTTVDNTIPDPVVPIPVDAFQMAFMPAEITLKTGESADVTLQLYKNDDSIAYPNLPTFFIAQTESGVVNIEPNICTLDINHQCKLHITALIDNKNIYVYPIIPQEYNYIQVLDLIVHTESAE